MTGRLSLILLFFLGLCLDSSGQALIRGKVYDKQSGEPLSPVNVIYGKRQGTLTDGDGRFRISTEPGILNLTFRYVGYKTVYRSVQSYPDDTLSLEIAMEVDIAEIAQIAVSAGKVEQRVSELTVSLNIIKPERLGNTHITDATELINKTPGIAVMDGQASIRGGSGYSYGAGSRVLTLLDGLPVLSADAGNIKWQFLPLENISQIEIIKGASSVLYGSSALNGVINFRTAAAGTEPETRFFIEGGLFDQPRNKDWVWWDTPRSFASASFSHVQKTGDTETGTGIYLLTDPGYRKRNDEKLGRVNLRLKRESPRVQGLSYGTTLHAGLTKKTDFILWKNAETGALIQDSATANPLTGHLVTIDPFVSLGRDRHRHDLRSRFQLSENFFPEGGQNNSRARSFLAEYRSRYSLLEWLQLNLGIYENYSSINSRFYGDHHALNLAAYSQADLTPVRNLKMVAGVRLEHNSLDGENDRLISLFRTGINYRLSDYTFLRASFGQGYRYPSIAEKHAATTLGSVRIVPNPDVLPESGWTAEAGIKQGISNDKLNGSLDIALFYSRNTDLIEYLFGVYPDPGDTTYSFGFKSSNVENSRVYGTELNFSLHGKAGRMQHSLSGGYTFIHPVEFNPESGEGSSTYLKYRRKHSFKLSYTSRVEPWIFGMDLTAASRILNIDEVFLDELTREYLLPGFYDYWQDGNTGHLVLYPHIGYSFAKHYRISIAVKNLLNTEYMGRPGDIQPQRRFSLRLSGKF